MITFDIVDLYPGTEPQKRVGIYAIFTINIKDGATLIAALHDMKLRKRKDQEIWYLESAFSEYNAKDGTKKKKHFIRLFPEKNDWNKQEPIVAMVREALKNYKPEDRTNSNSNVPARTASPKTNQPISPKPNHTDAW